jgi:hypothetical protein
MVSAYADANVPSPSISRKADMVSVNVGKAMLTGMVPAHSHRANTSTIDAPLKSHEVALMRPCRPWPTPLVGSLLYALQGLVKGIEIPEVLDLE